MHAFWLECFIYTIHLSHCPHSIIVSNSSRSSMELSQNPWNKYRTSLSLSNLTWKKRWTLYALLSFRFSILCFPSVPTTKQHTHLSYPSECCVFVPLFVVMMGCFNCFALRDFPTCYDLSPCYEQWILVPMKMLALMGLLVLSPNSMQWPIF